MLSGTDTRELIRSVDLLDKQQHVALSVAAAAAAADTATLVVTLRAVIQYYVCGHCKSTDSTMSVGSIKELINHQAVRFVYLLFGDCALCRLTISYI